MPNVIAAARLKRALAAELAVSPLSETSDGQLEFLSSLNVKRARDSRVRADQLEAEAWIQFYLLKQRHRALKRLRPEAGDIVQVSTSAGRQLGEVVSIGSNGRIHFKGGHGASAWPDNVTIQCRRRSKTKKAQMLRARTANEAAERIKVSRWSSGKELELEQFKVTAVLKQDDIEQLRHVIDSASDEKPIQGFLEERPQIMAAILRGSRSRFSVPRPQLGGKCIPDLLIADIDSLGIRWVLVELETPVSSVTLSGANLLDKYARMGVSQIEEWRDWIQNNLGLARRSRREGGLGLIDIRPGCEGLVFVGRRARLHENAKVVRQSYRETSRIQIHTYDWLLESLEGGMSFNGPTALNPHLIQPLEAIDNLGDTVRKLFN